MLLSNFSVANNQPLCRLALHVKIQAIAAIILLSASVLFAQSEPKTVFSPNNAYFAAVRSVADMTSIWKTDLDGFRLVVLPRKSSDTLGDVYFKADVPTRTVVKFQWSPDSQYLVMSTVSSDGHSPWNFETFVFSVADKSLRCMDDLVGPITSSDFHFELPSTLVVRIRGKASKAGESNDSKTVMVSLEKSFCKMHKLD